MKFLTVVLAVLGVGLSVRAQPGPVPGHLPIALAFKDSDVVCSGKVLSTVVESEEPPPIGLQHIRAIVEVQDAFKPADLKVEERLTLRFVRQYPGVSMYRPVVGKSETAILFLKKTADGSYEFANYWAGAESFQVLPKASGGTGLARLESALINALEQAPPGGPYHDDLRAVYMLESFPVLSPEGLARMSKLANSPQPDIALAAIGTLLKTKSPRSVELLRAYLESYRGDKEPMSVWGIGAWLREIDDPVARPTLEALSGSRFTSVQLGAMDALRKMKNPSSVPVLIQRLDDSNKVVRYQALITLSEIFHKDREFAPSMQLFDQDPERYVSAWKLWLSQPHGTPRPDEKRGSTVID